MTSEHRRIEDRHRLIASWMLTLLLYALIILLSLFLNLDLFKEMTDNPGPVNVRMGVMEGIDIPEPSAAPVPSEEPLANASPEPVPEPQASAESLPESSVAPEPVASTKPSANAVATPAPTPRLTPKPSLKPSVKPSPNTSPAPQPSPHSQASPDPDASPGIKPLLSPAASPAIVAEVKLPKGRDFGNSYETTFYNVKGFVGRVGGTPISQYMPLPQQVLGSIYENVGNGKLTVPGRDRQLEIFKEAYVQGGGNWQLRTSNVDLEKRDQLWAILEGAGYNVSQADYKYKNLKPVIIEFTLGQSENGRVSLKDIRVVQSSGDGSIDDAVVYGFRQVAAFANKTGEDVKGRYTYSFE